jgi:ABC-type nitrate/sulfonate/bicarbonate transport system substrate-binding protein
MRVMQMHETRADCDLVCDPFVLVGRDQHPDFALAGLYGKRVATVSEVPTPWLCLQEDLRRAGLDPEALPRIADRTMADNAAALRRGELDVVELFEPFAEELIAGEGHLWYAAVTDDIQIVHGEFAKSPMTKLLDQALAAARSLPPDAQDEIARVVLRLTGAGDEPPVALTPEEQAAIAASKAAAACGEFATE